MVTLTPNQIGALIVLQTGFGPLSVQFGTLKPMPNREWVATAIAVCMAESGGNTEAANGSSSATGLWQILSKTHAERVAAVVKDSGTVFKPEYRNLRNPVINTTVAKQLYNESGWKPWEAYNTGAYKRFLPVAYQAYDSLKTESEFNRARFVFYGYYTDPSSIDLGGIASPSDLSFGDKLGSAWDEAKDKFNPIPEILDFVKQSALPVGVFMLGIVLFVLGIWFTIKNTAPVKASKSAITKGVL